MCEREREREREQDGEGRMCEPMHTQLLLVPFTAFMDLVVSGVCTVLKLHLFQYASIGLLAPHKYVQSARLHRYEAVLNMNAEKTASETCIKIL